MEQKKLVFDDLKVCLSDEYIKTIQDSLKAGGGSLNILNPARPSLLSLGKFEDPFKETYTLIVMNQRGEKILITILAAVLVGSSIVLLIYVFRRVIRYGLRGYKVAKKIVLEEKLRERNKTVMIQDSSSPTLPSNYLRS